MATREEARHRLEHLARHRLQSMSKDDPMLHCWEMVAQGIEDEMLDVAELQKVLDSLKQWQGRGRDEILFEPWLEEVSADEWEEKVQVSLLGRVAYCPFSQMMGELQSLLNTQAGPERNDDDTR